MTKSKMNLLQLFATQVTTQTGSGKDLSPEMKTFYDKTLLMDAKPKLVHMQFGQKRPIPKGNGKTIEFRKFSSLPKATTPLTEGVTPEGSNLNVTAITATVNQYGDYICQSDVLELTAIDNTIVVGGTNVIYAPKIADGVESPVTSRANLDATAKLTPDVVFKAVTQLRAMNAPTINGDYIAIIHPHVAYDLMRHEEWIDVHKYATPENIYEGELGKLGKCRFIDSTEAKIWTGSGCPSGLAVYATLFFGDDAYGVTEVEGGGLQHIVKQKGSGGTSDPLDQRSSVGWKALMTAKRLAEEFLVRVESCSAYSATAQAN